MRIPNLDSAVRASYISMFNLAVPGSRPVGAPKRDVEHEIADALTTIKRGFPQYQGITHKTGVPPWFVGILHYMESGCNFNTHLHNGDPLSHRTVQVPAGRPLKGEPPFAWIDSTIDAMEMSGWTNAKVLRTAKGEPDWHLSTCLWRFEGWNGFGYRKWGVNSPYLWAGCGLEQPGRYVRDGVWDSSAWSKQIGAAVLLKAMKKQAMLSVDDLNQLAEW